MEKEKDFEDKVVSWLCESLGYLRVPTSSVSDKYIVADHMLDFIYSTQVDKWHLVTEQAIQLSEQELRDEFVNAVADYIFKEGNVASQLSQSQLQSKFSFYGESFFLIQTGTSAKYNRYAVVPQLALKHGNTYRRPDLVLFVNGIPFSILQLKRRSTGQSAYSHGINQILNDFALATSTWTSSRNVSAFTLYTRLIHFMAIDISEVYVWRNILNDYNAYFHEHGDNPELMASALRTKFSLEKMLGIGDTVDAKGVPFESPCFKVLHRLCSPEAIEHELCYNRCILDETGNSQLRVPRPVQVFGAEKVIQAICRDYQYESHSAKREAELRATLISRYGSNSNELTVFNERQQLRNGIDYFSYLLQYAPGAGKSDTIGFLAYRILTLKSNTGKHPFFDKVVIVVDRLNLHSQIHKTLEQIPAMRKWSISVPDNKKKLQEALKSNASIIVVNLQKFHESNTLIPEINKHSHVSGGQRTAIIIDEIHRSHSGDQHEYMWNQITSNAQPHVHMNTIIGLTATPSESALHQFGTYNPETAKLEPMDDYTFGQAIKDGHILNPLKALISFATAVDGNVTEWDHNKKGFYENKPRIAELSRLIVEYLTTTTFKQIGGKGSAMLVTHSVKAAINYFQEIQAQLLQVGSKKCAYIVYSNTSNKHPQCSSLTGMSVDHAIRAFKAEGGIIIVVDMLQTGFDYPYLHTLIIDKEISDINAVQTVCRVNRTAPGKNSCVVIDCSLDFKNIDGILSAFRKYSDVNSTESPSLTYENELPVLESELMAFTSFADTFQKASNSTPIAIETLISQHIDAEPVQVTLNLKSALTRYEDTYTRIKTLFSKSKQQTLLTNSAFIQHVRLWLKIIKASVCNVSSWNQNADFEDVDLPLTIGMVNPPMDFNLQIDETRSKHGPTKESAISQQYLQYYGQSKEQELHHDTATILQTFQDQLDYVFQYITDSHANIALRVRGIPVKAYLAGLALENLAAKDIFEESLSQMAAYLSHFYKEGRIHVDIKKLQAVPEYKQLSALIVDFLLSPSVFYMIWYRFVNKYGPH